MATPDGPRAELEATIWRHWPTRGPEAGVAVDAILLAADDYARAEYGITAGRRQVLAEAGKVPGRDGRPVPGVDDTGLVGWVKPDRDAQLPVPGHRTPIAQRIHVHTCGCVWTCDTGQRWARTFNCDRLDQELRRLTRDQH